LIHIIVVYSRHFNRTRVNNIIFIQIDWEITVLVVASHTSLYSEVSHAKGKEIKHYIYLLIIY